MGTHCTITHTSRYPVEYPQSFVLGGERGEGEKGGKTGGETEGEKKEENGKGKKGGEKRKPWRQGELNHSHAYRSRGAYRYRGFCSGAYSDSQASV